MELCWHVTSPLHKFSAGMETVEYVELRVLAWIPIVLGRTLISNVLEADSILLQIPQSAMTIQRRIALDTKPCFYATFCQDESTTSRPTVRISLGHLLDMTA